MRSRFWAPLAFSDTDLRALWAAAAPSPDPEPPAPVKPSAAPLAPSPPPAPVSAGPPLRGAYARRAGR